MRYKWQLTSAAILLGVIIVLNLKTIVLAIKGPEIPFEVSKTIIASRKCDCLIYSNNQTGSYTPSLLDGFYLGKPELKRLNFPLESNFFPQSISHECNFIAFASEDLSGGKFDILLYDKTKEEIINLSEGSDTDNKEAAFSPTDSRLAYISDFALRVYNYDLRQYVNILNPPALFTHLTWSTNGSTIFLQDVNSNIWVFRRGGFKKLWNAPHSVDDDRLITPLSDKEDEFYFVSSHESLYNQIYKYNSDGTIYLVVNTPHDKFLFQKPTSDGDLYFRTNTRGVYTLDNLKNGKHTQLISKGVVYDFFPDRLGRNVMVYSNNKLPASVFKFNDRKITNLLEGYIHDSIRTPEILYNKEGMFHLVYRTDTREKGWIVWLHGGPHEQVSDRYNPYIKSLTNSGYNVIALNYPGSTGIGDDYEKKGLKPDKLVEKQVEGIRRDVSQLKSNYKITKFSVIGVSYGSILAHVYAKNYSSDVTKVIDFSGIANTNFQLNAPILFIYGEYDFSLYDYERAAMLESYRKRNNTTILEFKDEGHVINNRKNVVNIIKKMQSFLEQ